MQAPTASPDTHCWRLVATGHGSTIIRTGGGHQGQKTLFLPAGLMARARRIVLARGPLQLTKDPMSAHKHRTWLRGPERTVPVRRICHQDSFFCDDHDQRLALPATEDQDGAMAKAMSRPDGTDVGG